MDASFSKYRSKQNVEEDDSEDESVIENSFGMEDKTFLSQSRLMQLNHVRNSTLHPATLRPAQFSIISESSGEEGDDKECNIVADDSLIGLENKPETKCQEISSRHAAKSRGLHEKAHHLIISTSSDSESDSLVPKPDIRKPKAKPLLIESDESDSDTFSTSHFVTSKHLSQIQSIKSISQTREVEPDTSIVELGIPQPSRSTESNKLDLRTTSPSRLVEVGTAENHVVTTNSQQVQAVNTAKHVDTGTVSRPEKIAGNSCLTLPVGNKRSDRREDEVKEVAEAIIDLTLVDSPKPVGAVSSYLPLGARPITGMLKSQLVTKSLKVTEDAKIGVPLKTSLQSNDYTLMVSMAELKMLENQIVSKRNDLQKTNDIMVKINLQTLPDRGKKLQVRSLDLTKELNELEQRKERLQSQMSDSSSKYTLKPQELAQVKPQLPAWKEIRRTGDVQHGMGVKAMENYYAEKSATLEVLKRLHNSLKSRPDAKTFAADPQNLRSSVKLMPHQKHALAWMMWREKEKPHGGILADDMGLGKTLTMISLVLKCAEDNIIWKDSDSEPDSEFKENVSEHKSKRRSTKGGTLVVCPASLLNQWAGEVKNRVRKEVLDVEVYHGPNRESRAYRLARRDIVVTTYSIVMNEHQKNGPIHQVRWQRIILDEAHTIRNYKCQTTLAVYNLKAHSRWALTGTPIHNKELDLFSLLKFLQCSPFDELPMWKKWVHNRSEGGMIRLQTVMNSIMLRRTKDQLTEEDEFACLPERIEQTIEVRLSTEEYKVYEKVLIFSRNLMIEFLHQKAEKEAGLKGQTYTPLNLGTMSSGENPFGADTQLGALHKKMTAVEDVKSHHILVLLLRLRQICCHPGLIRKMLDEEAAEQDGIVDKDGLDIDLVSQINRMSLSECKTQDFHPEDVLNDDDVLKLSNPVFDVEQASSKMQAVFACLKKNIVGSEDKAVVVSQWPSVLALMESHLKEMKLKTAMLTGAVPVKDRSIIVDGFNKAGTGPQVLLLSLTAGGVGLNLVGGNHLLLCDLHWNPQLESQACDRIYRIGQKKPVNIYRFICEDTIEQKIQSIQIKKQEIATNILTGARQTQASKLTMDDLKTIFNL